MMQRQVFLQLNLSTVLILLLAHFTHYVTLAWPTRKASHGSPYYSGGFPETNYIPESYGVDQVPVSSLYDTRRMFDDGYEVDEPQTPLDYYNWDDLDGLISLRDLYDEKDEAPVFGTIIDREPEYELEALKQNQYLKRKRAEPVKVAMEGEGKGIDENSRSAESSTSLPMPSTTSKVAEAKKETGSAKTADQSSGTLVGQKEVALLRPSKEFVLKAPSEARSASKNPSTEATITVMQRSNAKPSAYDKLRKYLSIEDALKKEAMNRKKLYRKRSSQFITEAEKLTKQLNNLKHTSEI